MTTNSLNNQCLNNYLVTSATNGVTRTLTVSNTTNAANSAAQVIAQVAGATAADPQLTTLISGGQTWSLGLDNSDSDAWVLSGNAALGTTNVMRVDTTGVINYPLQSAFLAYLASTASNKTGAATYYYLGSDALTEVYDQNSDFNVNGTFTAPITGRYFLSASHSGSGCTVADFMDNELRTSNRNFSSSITREDSTNDMKQLFSIFTDMDAGDTFTTRFSVSGEAGDTVDITGSGTFMFNSMSGFLVC